MRKMWLILAVSIVGGCDVGDAVSRLTAGVVGTGIDATKGVADGFKTGVEEGRKDSVSFDGSTVISTPAEVAAATHIEIISVRGTKEEMIADLSIENVTATPLHMIGLTDAGGALLIDTHGFSTPLSATETARLGVAIEVPPNAKVKRSLRFEGAAEGASAVRVWGQDLPVPAPVGEP